MDNVEEDPVPLEKTLPPRWRRFISEPFIDTSYAMLASTITHFGRHDIVLFHVQTNYVLLYQSSGQNSRDLNEPYNNIDELFLKMMEVFENIEKDFIPRFKEFYSSLDLRTCSRCAKEMEVDIRFI